MTAFPLYLRLERVFPEVYQRITMSVHGHLVLALALLADTNAETVIDMQQSLWTLSSMLMQQCLIMKQRMFRLEDENKMLRKELLQIATSDRFFASVEL